MPDHSTAVFLSYASQDAEAAKRICEALRAAGVEVWFDQNELVGGDAWDQKIRKHIKDCALLIPIISAATQARTEGYFRLEWRLADQRTHLMAKGRPFLLPVVIDDTRDADAQVPDSFTEVQWTRLPGGEPSSKFVERVKKLLAGDGRLGSGDVALRVTDQAARLPDPPRHRRKWLRPLFAAAVILSVVLAISLVKRSAPTALGGHSPLAVATKTPGSRPEVAQLLDRVRATTAKFDDILHTELDSMEELLGQAAKLDPADASIWAQWALVDCRYLNHSFDQTPARRDAARRHAAQAAGLAPDRAEVRLAQADVMMTLSGDATRAEATRILRPLLTEMPADGRVPLLLGWLAFDTTQPEAALAWFDRATQIPGYVLAGHFAKARMLFWSGRLSEGEAELNRALAAGTSAEVLLWKALLFATWRGDLSTARRTLAEVPPQSFVEDMPAAIRYWVELLSGNYEQALAALRMVPHDYLQSDAYRGPVGYLSGIALAEAGKKAAAELEWRSALATVESRLHADPNGRELMQFKALLQALLGDREAGRKTFRAVQELYGPGGKREVALQLQFLPTDEAYAWVAGKVAEGSGDCTAALLQLDPVFAAIRSDPRFPALLAQAEADPRLSPKAGAKPAAGEIPGNIAAKSVAVLAFANLSDDKANEYFSDGISEELLNVLAKIPGLKVSARTSAFYFKGKEVPIPEIAKQLGVAYVVEGSVRKQGDKVRITAQLIKAADGFHVWSDTFTRDLKDIFAVQDEIAGLIAQNLSLKLGMVSSGAGRPVDPEAFRLMLAGRDLLYRGQREDLAQGQQYLLDAISRDERFALAWAWLSITRWSLAANGGTPIDSGFKSAREAAEKALALQSDLPEANTAVGLVYYGYDWDWARARAAFDRALVLAPGDAAVVSELIRLAITLGENDEAVRLGRQAVALDPLNTYAQYVLSMALLQAGRYRELEQQAMEFKSVTHIPTKQQVFALVLQGKNEAALQLAGEFKQNNDRAFLLGLAHWACGHRAEADENLARLQSEYGTTAAYQIAELHSYRGETDEAFTWLETSYRQRDTGMIYLKNDPWFKTLRADARWPALLKKMNLLEISPR